METQTTKDRVLDMIDERIGHCRREAREAREGKSDYDVARIEGGLWELRQLKRQIEKEIKA